MSNFQKVATVNDLKEGEIKAVTVNGDQIALYKLGGEIFATTDICTHEQCIISDNYYIEGEEVECTCHGSRYEIKTGANTVPPSAAPLRLYPVKIENEEVFVEV